MVLANLKASAQAFLAARVERAVITCPAYLGDAQRLATRHAGQIAGQHVARDVGIVSRLDRKNGIGIAL